MKTYYQQNKGLMITLGVILLLLIIAGGVFIYRRRQEMEVKRGSGPSKAGSNNPMNIKSTSTVWEGENTPEGETFETFKTPALGYRAGFVLLYNYMKNGYNTIRKIIYRYAPPSDNNPTNAYVNFMMQETGINPDAWLDQLIFTEPNPRIIPIVAAISKFENGKPANMKDVNDGYQLFRTNYLHL